MVPPEKTASLRASTCSGADSSSQRALYPGGRKPSASRHRGSFGIGRWLVPAPQDVEVDALELGGRVHSKLVGEQFAALVVHGDRLGLASGGVQRAHELGAGTFGQRVGGEQHAELTDQAGSLTEGQVGLDPVRQHAGAQFGQPGRGRGREVRSGRVGQRLAPPGEQRVPQDPRGLDRVAVGQRAPALCGQFLERGHVDRARRHGQAVSGRVRLDHVACPGLAQLGSQPGDQRLQRVAGVAGRVLGPELPRQRAGRDDTPGVQGEQGEQHPQLAAADVDRAPRLVPHLKRAQ